MKNLNIDSTIIKNFIENRKEYISFKDVELHYIDFDNFENSKNIIYPFIKSIPEIKEFDNISYNSPEFKNAIASVQNQLPFYILKFSNNYIQISDDSYFLFKTNEYGLLFDNLYSNKPIIYHGNIYSFYFKFKNMYVAADKFSIAFNGTHFFSISSYILAKYKGSFNFGKFIDSKNEVSFAELIIEQIPFSMLDNIEIFDKYEPEYIYNNHKHLYPIRFKIYNGFEIIHEETFILKENEDFVPFFERFVRPYFLNFSAIEVRVEPAFTKEYIEYFNSELRHVVDMIEY